MMVCSQRGYDSSSLELEPPMWFFKEPHFLLVVRVKFRLITTAIETRVLYTAWHGFVQELTVLAERRQGEAKLAGVSPDELSLVFRPTDDTGNMCVEGKVAARGDGYCGSLDFAVLPFDHDRFTLFVEDAQDLADHMIRISAPRTPAWARR